MNLKTAWSTSALLQRSASLGSQVSTQSSMDSKDLQRPAGAPEYRDPRSELEGIYKEITDPLEAISGDNEEINELLKKMDLAKDWVKKKFTSMQSKREWVQYVDEASGLPYYCSLTTGETSWMKPKDYSVDPSVFEYQVEAEHELILKEEELKDKERELKMREQKLKETKSKEQKEALDLINIGTSVLSRLHQYSCVTMDQIKNLPNISAVKIAIKSVAVKKLMFDGESIITDPTSSAFASLRNRLPFSRSQSRLVSRRQSRATSRIEGMSSIAEDCEFSAVPEKDRGAFIVVTVVDSVGNILGRSAQTPPGQLSSPIYILRGDTFSTEKRHMVFIQAKRLKTRRDGSMRASEIAHTFISIGDLDRCKKYDITLPMYKKPANFSRDTKSLRRTGGHLTLEVTF